MAIKLCFNLKGPLKVLVRKTRVFENRKVLLKLRARLKVRKVSFFLGTALFIKRNNWFVNWKPHWNGLMGTRRRTVACDYKAWHNERAEGDRSPNRRLFMLYCLTLTAERKSQLCLLTSLLRKWLILYESGIALTLLTAKPNLVGWLHRTAVYKPLFSCNSAL